MRVFKKTKGLYVFLILAAALIVVFSVYVGAKAADIQKKTEALKKMEWTVPLGIYDSTAVISGSDGLYAVEKNEKWGIVNREGEIVLPLKYDWITEKCDSGLIPVSRGDLCGFVDEKGQIAVDLQYEYASPFEKGYAAVFKDEYHYIIDVKGHKKYAAKIKEGQLYTTGKAGYAVSEDLIDEEKDIKEMKIIDLKKGKAVFSSDKYYNAGYSEGLWSVSRVNESGCEFWDDRFRRVFDITSEDDVHIFSEGLAANEGSDHVVRYYDKEGKSVIKTEGIGYDFSEGIACVVSGRHGKFIDKKGETLFTLPAYHKGSFMSVSAEPLFQEGYCLWQAKNGEYGYLNKSGEYTIEPIFEEAGMVYHGEAAVTYGSEAGVLKLPVQ